MSEYWVSQPKHWCEHCRCWTQGDALSIKHHEGGSRHKESLKNFLINTRKRKADDRREADEKEKTLRAMTEAAETAVATDFRQQQQQQQQRAPPPPPPRPPPPPPLGAPGLHFVPRSRGFAPWTALVPFPPGARAGSGSGSGSGGAQESSYAFGPSGEAAEEEDLGDGTYEVEGKYYLMGEHGSAAGFLVPGSLCQALQVGEGLWCLAEVVGEGKEVVVPNTTLRTRRYPIKFLDPAQGGSGVAGEATIPAASLRVPLTEAQRGRLQEEYLAAQRQGGGGEENGGNGSGGGGGSEVNAGAPSAPPPPPPPPPIDDNTGLGVWQTVVRGEEEEEEEEEEGGGGGGRKKRGRRGHEDGDPTLAMNHADPSKALDRMAAASRGAGRDAVGGAGDDEEEDGGPDSFQAFNPYGGNTYKGFNLGGGGGGGGGLGGVSIKKEVVEGKSESGWSGGATTTSLLPAVTAPVPLPPGGLPLLLPPPVEFKVRGKPNNARARKREDD